MNRALQICYWVFDRLLVFYPTEFRIRYGEEMKAVFREQVRDASEVGPLAVMTALNLVAGESIAAVANAYCDQVRLIALSACAASALFVVALLGFCTLNAPVMVYASAQAEVQAAPGEVPAVDGKMVTISGGHKMFLECDGESHGGPTVILATGRGLGSYKAWALVQQRVAAFARVCSYDPLGAGQSDHVPGAHPLSEVVSNMHELFQDAEIQKPLVLVGASAGGLLIRAYEERYPAEVAGFVFVDSAHEEQEWRDAAISKSFDPNWDNAQFLEDNGFLLPEKHLQWHDDVPLIVLERSELPPRSAFPDLTQQQVDEINEAWHSFQVDLSRRSKYGELRSVSGSGHFMHQQRPDAIAQAVQDVLAEIKHKHP